MTQLKQIKLAVVIASAALVLSACGKAPSVNSEMFSSSDSNIVGGEAVKASEVFSKSTVALATVKYGIFCSGSLINENMLVTAAHCADIAKEMDKDDRMVVVFSRSLSVKKLPSLPITHILQHPAWAKRSEQDKDTGDVAIMKFAGALPKGYKAANVLTDSASLKNGAEVVLAGFGVLSMKPETDAKELMKATVLLTDKDYSKTEVKFDQYEGRGACHGDSGGPAYTKVNGKWVLFGVTSRSATYAGGSNCLEGSIYTNLAAHAEFLKKAEDYLNSPDADKDDGKEKEHAQEDSKPAVGPEVAAPVVATN